jgi:ribosomal protein L37AE/L43A
VKITRMRNLYQKLRDGVEKLKIDNRKVLGYATGMMGPDGGGEDHGRQQEIRNDEKPKPICRHCGSSSHSRRTSRHCPANPAEEQGFAGINTTRYVDGIC